MRSLKHRIESKVVLPAVPRGIRLTVIGIFALVGAGLFGVYSTTALNALLFHITKLFNSSQIEATTAVYPQTFVNVFPSALLGGILGGFLGTGCLNGLERLSGMWERMEIGDRVNVFFGAIVGIVAGVQLFTLFQNIKMGPGYSALLCAGLILAFSALSIYLLQSISEVLPWTKTKGRIRRSGIKLMDTNIIIDGRIYDIAKAGFLVGQLYVPGFVLDELQYIADSHDALRRARGRRGLEVLKHMQAEFPLDVRIHDKLAPEMQDGVDARLVRLAKALGADIVTNDFNLKRVAELQEIHVLSLNDLSLALRPNVLPQETMPGLKIIKEGNQYGQGVGYLDDGTMVVVENGQNHVGETHDVVVTQVIQTERGKMIFAELEDEEHIERTQRRKRTI